MSALPGDYNDGGTVDAADYTIWRDLLGSITSLPNDDTAGVGPDDNTRWKTNFGQTVGSGAGADVNAAVPEPATVAILFVAMLAMCARRCAVVSYTRTFCGACHNSTYFSDDLEKPYFLSEGVRKKGWRGRP